MTEPSRLSLSEALAELDTCRWMRIKNTSVRARRWFGHTRRHAEADVMVRRGKSESFEQMVIRAATLVRSGHMPTRRPQKPKTTPTDMCRCGAVAAFYYNQLQAHVCQRCALLWRDAAERNDMRPSAYNDKGNKWSGM